MPIYEQAYRKYEARGPLRKLRSWPITREALRTLFARKIFSLLMAVTWFPFVGFSLYVYFVVQVPDIRRLAPLDGSIFANFLNLQTWLALFPAILGGAGLVANDLRTGAILVYLSRPLTRRDYVLGKLGVLLALTLAVILVPGVSLYAVALALAPQVLLNWEHAYIGPAVVLHSIVASAVLSLVALGLSALSKSARVAGLAFFGLMVALGPIALIIRAISDWPAVPLLSIMDDITFVGDALFGVQGRMQRLPWPYPAGVLVLVCLGSLAVLRARVKAVEIVR